jgi:hypothetical protein
MVLRRQNVPVVLGTGLDTKSDAKTLQAGLLTAENVVVQKTGELRKRKGYTSLGIDVLGGDALAEGIRLATFDDEIVMLNSRSLYSYATTAMAWAAKGGVATSSVQSRNVVTNSYEQLNADAAYVRGTIVYAWEDSRGGVRATVVDQDSGASLIADTSLSVTGSRPRCFAIGTYLFVLYFDSDSNDLVSQRIDTSNPFEFSIAATVANDIDTANPIFDICQLGTSRMVVAYRNASAQLQLAYLLQTNAVGSTADGVPGPTAITAENPTTCITVVSGVPDGTTATFHVVWFNTTSGLKTMGLYSDFTTYKAAVVLDSDVATTVRNVTALAYRDSFSLLNQVEIFYERNAAAVINRYVSRALLSVGDNLVSSTLVFQRSAGLASKAYRSLNSSRMLVAYESAAALQDTYFSISDNLGAFATGWGYDWGSDWGGSTAESIIQAKVLPTVAGGHTEKVSQLAGAWLLEGTEWLIATLRKTRIIADNVDTYTLLGVNSLQIDHSAPRIGTPAQLAGNLHIPGGYLKIYDGVSVVEHGFHIYPDASTIAQSGASGLANGRYQYIVVYEWIDGRGQIHRSVTGVPQSFTVTGGPRTVTLTIPTLRYTAKKAPVRAEVVISVYRTAAAGTLFYKASSDTSPLYNNPTADTVSFVDTMVDATLTSRPLLYTTGGTLDNFTVPSCDVVRVYKNRLFVAGLERESDVLFSKAHVTDEGVAFSDLFNLQVGNQGGAVTALAVLDEKLVLFKETSIYILTGDGPTDTGAQNDFLVPQQIASDVGCTEPESIVETPNGVMFKSAKGIYILSRSLQVEYVGAKVEEFNALNVSGAVVVPDQNQVRFTTTQGRSLVYDYFFQVWTTFTNQEAVSAVGWQNDFVFLKSNGEAWQESSSYNDAGSVIRTRIATQWFQTGGLQGFQRCYMGVLIGEYVGEHRLRVRVAYDFEPFYREEFLMNPTPVVTGDAFGTGTYGSGAFGGGTGVYQFEFKPARQKCQAMRLLIEDTFPDNEGTGAFNITGLTLVIGVKGGTNRLPDTQRMGAT